MMTPDIIKWIDDRFTDKNDIEKRLSFLHVSMEQTRIIRCILKLSDSDPDSISAWVKLANTDYRDVIMNAEYDNREVRIFNFNNSLYEQGKMA
jgi:hypothetical protein